MYPAKHYQSSEDSLIHYHEIIEHNPLATLVFTHNTEINISHIPCHFAIKRLDATTQELDNTILTAHVSNLHPLAEALKQDDEVVLNLIFHGEDTYLSPRDISSRHKHAVMVPTWNYAKVQVSGVAHEINNLDKKYEYLVKSTEYFEYLRSKIYGDTPWSITEAPATAINQMLNAITLFQITITHLEGRFKLSQNKSKAVQKELAEQLVTRGMEKLGKLMMTR